MVESTRGERMQSDWEAQDKCSGIDRRSGAVGCAMEARCDADENSIGSQLLLSSLYHQEHGVARSHLLLAATPPGAASIRTSVLRKVYREKMTKSRRNHTNCDACACIAAYDRRIAPRGEGSTSR